MAAYTITTTAAEERAIAFALSRINANRAEADPPQAALTAAELIADVVRGALAQHLRQLRKDEAEAVKTAFSAAGSALQSQIKTALGVA